MPRYQEVSSGRGGQISDQNQIKLRLEGSRAAHGIALSSFESFIENFLSAVRAYARDRAGAEGRKPGRPEAQFSAVAAFRLVEFREGSAIATVEPDLGAYSDETDALVDVEPLQVSNLRSLLSDLEQERPLPETVYVPLGKAIRAAGDDGILSVESDSEAFRPLSGSVTIDSFRLERIRAVSEAPPTPVISSISGRLHQVDFEPDKLAIRASDGVDWVCEYPAGLEQRVETLVNRLVEASGSGRLESPTRGKMELDSIQAIEQGIQGGLFSGEPISDRDLAEAQGITKPQGLDTFAAPEWTDADEEYLAALNED